MTRDPKTIGPDALVATALETLNSASITALLVVQEKSRSASSTCTTLLGASAPWG